jgi:hypothetical protein
LGHAITSLSVFSNTWRLMGFNRNEANTRAG